MTSNFLPNSITVQWEYWHPGPFFWETDFGNTEEKIYFYYINVLLYFFQVFQLSRPTKCASLKFNHTQCVSTATKHHDALPNGAWFNAQAVPAKFYGLPRTTIGNFTYCAAAKFWKTLRKCVKFARKNEFCIVYVRYHNIKSFLIVTNCN